MVLVENDRWRAEVPLTRLGRWVFTIEAWPDEFESWRSDVAKKLAAGQKIDLDIREGLDLLRRAAATETGTAATRVAKILKQQFIERQFKNVHYNLQHLYSRLSPFFLIGAKKRSLDL